MQPSPEEIRAQLDRLLASPMFVHADRLSRFLRYVVEQALAGEGERLKEYVLGVEVFDRDERYDPRLDSIVRVEAGRLRSKLDEYYNADGAGDTVLIRLRRGSYAPLFERRQLVAPVAESPPAPSKKLLVSPLRLGVLAGLLLLIAVGVWRAGLWAGGERSATLITVVVMPFTHYPTDVAAGQLAPRITDGVTSELVHNGAFSVIPRTVARERAGQSPWVVAKELNADVVVEATVETEEDRVSVEVRLISLYRKFRVDDVTVGTVAELPELERKVAAVIASAVRARPRE